MSHGIIYIRLVETIDDVADEKWETLEENGNAQEFCNHLCTGVGAVAALTGNKNNYTPTDWIKYKTFCIGSTVAVDITGWAAGKDWEMKTIYNRLTFPITLKHKNTSSLAANRMLCHGNADIILNENDKVCMEYDPVATRWRVR